MRFEFAAPQLILFGPGTSREVGRLAADLGHRALLVTGRTPKRARPVADSLAEQGVRVVSFAITGEPTTDDVRRGLSLAAGESCDLVIGVGGGSPMDAAKAIAAILTNGGDPMDYMEVIGKGRPLAKPSAPCIAIPSTAGTGTEATRNAVIASPEHRVKVSLRGLTILPTIAIVDPELTYSMPPSVTASTGLDALTQIIEPFVSAKANPLTDAICRDGLARIARSLRIAYRRGENAEARLDMSLAGLYGGMALANASLGVVHGFAGVIGGMFPSPHGAVCAALLAASIEANVGAFRERQAEHGALRRYEEIARILTGDPKATAGDGAAWIRKVCLELAVPPLLAYGLTREDFDVILDKSAGASSMKANPIALTRRELEGILAKSLE
jgi:alcohol dehydrogenase class IV